MSKSNAFENDLLEHVFQNAALALVGDASGLQPSATPGSLYVSLHTADPGEGGDQTTNETAYSGYARVGVVRSALGWTVTGNAVENAAEVAFPARSGGTGGTLTHFGIGCSASGAGKLLYSGALAASLVVSEGVTPRFAAGAIDVTED